MWDTLGEVVEIDIEELAPELFAALLEPEAVFRLMEYLWATYLGDRAPADDELGSVEEALRFLAMAMFVAGAMEIARGQDPSDARDRFEVPEKLVHPFALGFQLAHRGIEPDYALGFGGTLNELVGAFENEVVGELGQKLSYSEFFISILGALRGIEQFPVSDEDMEVHNIEFAVTNPEQGMLLDYLTNSWPREPRQG